LKKEEHSLKITAFLIVMIVLLSAALAACGDGAKGPFSSGDLFVNGTGIDGGVNAGETRFYTLRDIKQGARYTVRTQIVTNTALDLEIYTSETSFKSGQTKADAIVSRMVVTGPSTTSSTEYREAQFTATQNGDYVVVVGGAPADPTHITQLFFDLRLMSASVLTNFTSTLPESIDQERPIQAGEMKVYKGADTVSVSTHTISLSLSTAPSTTTAYPHVFVFADDTLSLGSLIRSSISTSTGFQISAFAAETSTSTTTLTILETTTSDSARILNVPFTTTGPYIVVKGNAALNYTLTIEP
jgi:hypothetical protein